MKPIRDAIFALLQLKSPVNYTEVASLLKIDKKKVLDVILTNKRFLVIDKKGKIERFTTTEEYRSILAANEIAKGTVYYLADINYGCDKCIQLSSIGEDKVKDLIEPYICGGIGDNYTINVILDSPENRKEMSKRGFTLIDDFKNINLKDRTINSDWFEIQF